MAAEETSGTGRKEDAPGTASPGGARETEPSCAGELEVAREDVSRGGAAWTGGPAAAGEEMPGGAVRSGTKAEWGAAAIRRKMASSQEKEQGVGAVWA